MKKTDTPKGHPVGVHLRKNSVSKPLLISLNVLLCLTICSCTIQNDKTNSDNSTKPEGSKQETSIIFVDPNVEKDDKLPSGTRTTWQCVYFGSYPTVEVVDKDSSAVEKYAVSDGDLLVDENLYTELKSSSWKNDETTINDNKFRRLKASEDYSTSNQHYKWDDSYHYFRYEPIKWRIIKVDNDNITMVADRLLECVPYNANAEDVYWENCTLRDFLNNEFYYSAFSEEEQKAVIKSRIQNTDNYYFGTECGNDTEDYVYIFTEQDVFNTDVAEGYGFTKSDGISDTARRFRPTMYAMAKGAWYSPVETNCGNGFWLLRTCGYTPSNVNYVCDFGSVYNRGTYVNVKDAGIIPVIRVDKKKTNLIDAGTVTSADIFKGEKIREKQQTKYDPDKVKKAFGFSEPVVVKDDTYSSGLKTTWSSLYFGSYPTKEVVSEKFSAVQDYAVDNDVIINNELYQKLVSAEWNDNTTILDNDMYCRMKSNDAVRVSKDSSQHYNWDDDDSYHYFKYEPIKWRVLELNGNEAMLVADREMDCFPYNAESKNVQWKDCTLRRFLNTDFYNRAFTEDERRCIITSQNDNPDNIYYGTDCGDTTEDKVFILSSDEVYGSTAAVHGFYPGGGVDDPARRFRPTMYAKARGTWYSPVKGYEGNGFWFMRTNGYSLSSASYICDFGYIYNSGTNVACNDSGVLPVIRLDLSKANIKEAENVTS